MEWIKGVLAVVIIFGIGYLVSTAREYIADRADADRVRRESRSPIEED